MRNKNVQFSARLPEELVRQVKLEARRRHSTSTAIVVEALEKYFRPDPEERLAKEVRAAIILCANALSGGDKERAKTLRRMALEMAEKEKREEKENV